MNPNLMQQMAHDRRGDLLRAREEYRRARLTARRTVLIRIAARIPRFPSGTRRSRKRVVVPSTPGRMPLARIHLLKGRSAAEKATIALSIQSALVSTLKVPGADRYRLLIVEITSLEDRRDQVKKSLLVELNHNLVAAGVVATDDVCVTITEIGRANVSFGGCAAPAAPASEPVG